MQQALSGNAALVLGSRLATGDQRAVSEARLVIVQRHRGPHLLDQRRPRDTVRRLDGLAHHGRTAPLTTTAGVAAGTAGSCSVAAVVAASPTPHRWFRGARAQRTCYMPLAAAFALIRRVAVALADSGAGANRGTGD